MVNAFAAFAAWFSGIIPLLIRLAAVILAALLLGRLLPKLIFHVNSRVVRDETITRYVVRTVKILVWLLAVIVALDICGLPVASLLTVVAAVGAAIALAIKDNLANLASGIVLLFTKPFKAGDFIGVDGVSGTIREINMMQTYVDTVDNTLSAIPNSKMMSATITNYSAHDTRRQDLFFAVGSGTDLARARSLLTQTALDNPMVLREPEGPFAAVWEHKDGGIVLLLRVWCRTADALSVKFALNEEVNNALGAAGIGIAYPQLSVHIDK